MMAPIHLLGRSWVRPLVPCPWHALFFHQFECRPLDVDACSTADKYFLWQSNPTATLIQAAVTKQAETFLSAREALIGNISSLEEWQARQATVKELLNSKVGQQSEG
jgi:hypothetical protein